MLDEFGKGQVFFLEWPTWARLAVLLGGTLTLILLVAFLVKFKNWARDKRRTRRAAEEQAERGEMTLIDDLEDDTSFGIRALLEDPEVEGVWNSREVTPMHLDGAARTPSPSQLKISPPKHASNSFTSTYETVDIGSTSPTALTPLTDSLAVVDPSAEQSTLKNRKTLVISYNSPHCRSENAKFVSDVGPSMRRERLTQSTSKMQLRHISNLPCSGPRKFVIGSRQKSPPRHQRTQAQSEDNPLERMEVQRRLHSAESGQLLPRDRRHSDMAQAVTLAPFLSDSEESDDSTSRALSWPSREGTMNLGKQLSRRVQRMEAPRPVPFRAFVESLPTSKPPPSAWTDKTQAKMEAKVPSSKASGTTSKTSKHTPDSSISSTTSITAPTSSPSDPMSIVNTRARKINDGFELLPAGALEKGPTLKEFGTGRYSSKGQKKPKKLQKRSRSDSASRSSTESQRRSSSDSFRLPIF